MCYSQANNPSLVITASKDPLPQMGTLHYQEFTQHKFTVEVNGLLQVELLLSFKYHHPYRAPLGS